MKKIDDRLIALFYSDLPLNKVAQIVHKRTTYVNKMWALLYGSDAVGERKRSMYVASKIGDKNPCFGKTGKEHPVYKKGYWIRNGYKWIPAPDWYNGPNHSGYTAEHIIVYCIREKVTSLPTDTNVHHVDLKKSNNDPSNLILLSVRDHRLLHVWLNSEEGVETISKESRVGSDHSKRVAPEKGGDIVHASTEVEELVTDTEHSTTV